MRTSKPLLLLGTGSAAWCEFPLARIAAKHPVLLASTAAPAWARPYLAGHLDADLTDPAALLAVVKEYASTHDLCGVLTYIEQHLVTAAWLAQSLQLPGPAPQAMAACRDRVTMRRLFAEHGVPSARWIEASDSDAAAVHAQLIGYPIVLKPRGMTGRVGVVHADDSSQVRAAFDRALRETALGPNPPTGVLVEEYLDGPEISAETVVLGTDDIRIAAVSRTAAGPSPSYEASGHCVDARDALLHDSGLHQVVASAVRALGIAQGVLHTRVKLTHDGPLIVEADGRLGDDLIPLLVKRATGIDLAQAAAALATGDAPDLGTTRQRASAIRFAYPTTTGRINRLDIPAAAAHQPQVDRFVLTQQAGNTVASHPHATPADRLAHWVVMGSDAADCQTRLDRLERLLSVDIATPVSTAVTPQISSPRTR